jgi:hypothetical protein
MTDFDPARRLPLPSEDGGDLVETPPSGETDDPLVASEEGVPYVPPSDPVLSSTRSREGGPDVAGTAPTAAGELERNDDIQTGRMDAETLDDEVSLDEESVVEDGAGEDAAVVDLIRELPVDDELAADVIEQLRDSNVPAGDRLRISAVGSIVTVRGEVESIDVLEELLGLIGDVPGVEQVNDEVEISGV